MRRPLLYALLFLVPATFLATASGDIANSHHNFGKRVSGNQQQLCNPCHTPHNASTTELAAPLWNHQTTTASFTPYVSPTMNASVGQPGGVTKLCLSCHDGTVAIDSFGGLVGSQTIDYRAKTGVDLTKHHPVSFVYDSALASADGELWDPLTAPSGLGGTIAQDMLRDGRLECSACHDVQVSRSAGASCTACHPAHGSGYSNTLSLWKSNSQSALCLTCHKK